MSTLWMMVDLKDNELPLAVADSLEELAELAGVKKKTITSRINSSRRRGTKCKYVKVQIDEEGEQL